MALASQSSHMNEAGVFRVVAKVWERSSPTTEEHGFLFFCTCSEMLSFLSPEYEVAFHTQIKYIAVINELCPDVFSHPPHKRNGVFMLHPAHSTC